MKICNRLIIGTAELFTLIFSAGISVPFLLPCPVSNTYLLLTEFEVCTVSYGPSFFNGKKRGFVTHSTDRENEDSKIFTYISEVNRTRGKRTAFNFSGPNSEIRPAKLTNHNVCTKIKCRGTGHPLSSGT